MAATAVAKIENIGAAAAGAPSSNTLTLPVGRQPRKQKRGQVLRLDDQPKAHVTSDAEAAEAKRAAAQRREWESRERARVYLRQWHSGDAGAEGAAMLARPHKDIPLAFISPDAVEASLTRQFCDNHLIDRMWDSGQLNDWQYAAANRLLILCGDAGLLPSSSSPYGRVGPGQDMSDAMAAARARWNHLMNQIGRPGDELLTSLCHEQLTIRGQAARVEALKDGLRFLAKTWGIEIT